MLAEALASQPAPTWRPVEGEILINDATGQVVILGSPQEWHGAEDPDGESAHDCDAMGCRGSHVVLRGSVR